MRGRYIAQRFMFAAITIAIAATINFAIFRAAPGDASAQYQSCRQCTAEFRAQVRTELGLDKPLAEQYALYVSDLAGADLGRSFETRRPVSDALLDALLNTLPMLALGLTVGIAVGLLVGVVAAWRRGTAADWLPISGSLLLYSLPIQWVGLVLLFAFSGTLPTAGVEDPFLRFSDPAWWDVLVDRLEHMILPSLTIALVSAGYWALIVRSSMLDALGEDYILTARAKGFSNWAIVRRHALRNSLLPIATLMFLTLGYIVAGSLLVEIVFSYPGLGLAVYEAVQDRDYPMLQGAFLLLAVAIVLANFAADLLYVKLDPRILG